MDVVNSLDEIKLASASNDNRRDPREASRSAEGPNILGVGPEAEEDRHYVGNIRSEDMPLEKAAEGEPEAER